jgi:anthranilate/para-aminobenzoate synthase component II
VQGDPSAAPYAVENAKKILGKKPVFGICMGHQILGQAFGGKTFKLKFGHHGGNHPIRFNPTGQQQQRNLFVSAAKFYSKAAAARRCRTYSSTVAWWPCSDWPGAVHCFVLLMNVNIFPLILCYSYCCWFVQGVWRSVPKITTLL